jgi:hypothetical protein
MIRRLSPLVVALSVCWGSTAAAQVPEWVSQLLIAAQLPVSTLEARKEGVPGDEIRAVLEALRTARVPAHDARELIDEERTARREHGPVDNFGAFVQTKLQAGLRGRDLAAAIRAEHEARGKGHAGGHGQAKGQSKGQSSGPANASDSARATRGKAAIPATKCAADSKRPDAKGAPARRPNR